MRRLLPLVALLVACGDSPAPVPNATCNLGECSLPKNLVLGAELTPPTDSSLVETDFSPEEIELSDGLLSLAFGTARDVSVDVRAQGAEDTVLPADVVLSRTSAIPGRPAVPVQTTTGPGLSATVRVLADATYAAFATPHAPEDQGYLRNVTRGITLDDELRLLLATPVQAIEGHLLTDEEADVNVRLQAFRPGGDERTTVARIRPGDAFSLGALEIEGDWTVQAKATFPDPKPEPGAPEDAPLEGLDLVLEADVTCQGELVQCVLSEGPLPDLDIPLPPLPEPQPRSVLVRGVDAAGVPTVVPSAEIRFESDIAVPGAQKAILTARASSDEEGSALVYLVDGFEYRVTVSPPSGSEFATRTIDGVSVQAATGPMQIDLGLRPKLSGRVFAARPQEADTGLAGATVTAVPSPNQQEIASASRSGVSFTASTNERGDFLLRVDPGVYDVRVAPLDGSTQPIWSSDNVPVESDVLGHQIVLPQGIPIPVLVRAEGLPVAGATVRILAVSEEEGRAPRMRGWGVTDELGEAVIILPNP